MAVYNQPCIHCGVFIPRDARVCPKCGSRSPFGYLCPSCLKSVQKDDMVCAGCGRPLYIPCPSCQARTFVDARCGACGASLMIHCQNPRCGQLQFYENKKCTACGKKIK